MTNRAKIRVGAVNYLNTKPLVYDLARFAPQAELVFDYPSRLADNLAAGRLDVALIPSIEFFHDPSYTIVSDACIGCRGPVLSVKLFSRGPIENIRTLALDEGSRTSVALTRILLQERYGVAPKLEGLPVGSTLSDTTADAVLLIGDRAMHSPAGQFEVVWDLGDEWCRWAELPFVFAMWVARAGRNWMDSKRPFAKPGTPVSPISTISPPARPHRWDLRGRNACRTCVITCTFFSAPASTVG